MSIRRTSLELQAVREAVRDLASVQGGVFRRSDLVAWGIEPSVAVSMRRSGDWVRLHHGVYVDRVTLDEAQTPAQAHALYAAATIAALPEGIALFGPSAAVHLGKPVDRAVLGRVHLVRPPGSDSRALRRRITASDRLPEAVIHVLDVPEHLLTRHGGLPTVTADLAACGTAMLSEPDWAVATLDSVAWQDPSAIERMQEIGRMWPRLAGAGNLRAALPHVRTGAQTPLESLSRLKLVRCGLPEPHLQVPLYDDEGLIGIVDMLFDELGVVGEADGDAKYEDRAVLLKEKRREDRIRAKDHPVVRWGWTDAMGPMQRTAHAITSAGRLRSLRRAG